DIEKTPVYYGKNGSIILLKDVAEIYAGYKDEKSITRLNSNRSIGILIQKEANSNTVKVCSTLRKSLEQLRKEFPTISFEIPVDQSIFIKESIKSVIEAIIIGGFLAFLVLFFFLKDLKSPFHISFVIPIAILTTFILMYFNKITLNIISLSGLALGVGMLVDNSIVVSENIFRHRSKGENWKKAAYIGTKEVGMPIMASTLTTLAVFLPIIYVKGIASALFRQQALTVTFSLLSSLLVSLTMLPLLASLREKEEKDKTKKQHNKFTKIIYKIIKTILFPFFMIRKITQFILKKIGKTINSFLEWFQLKYEIFATLFAKLLNFSLAHRTSSILIFIALFLSSLGILSTIDREFFPDFEQPSFTILLRLDAGTPLEKTDAIIFQVEEYLKNDARIENFFTSVGKSTEDKLS
ncbi:MAG: efflux RND transporter permease subunit, partial [Candidatus Cloacimonetes bacterium]|nr:efflux RND transporter permease subunit [Candidatus Cloacimonadota bacterium]